MTWFKGKTSEEIADQMAASVQWATVAEAQTYLRAFKDGIRLAGASEARIEAIETAFRNRVKI